MAELNLNVPLEHALQAIKQVYEVGLAHPSKGDLSSVRPFSPLWRKGKFMQERLDDVSDGYTYRELLTRYLYLWATLDQGPDPVGIAMFLGKVTNQAYESDIPFLHKPITFFEQIDRMSELIDQAHEDVKAIRAPILSQRNVRNYSLLDAGGRTRLMPHVSFRWGTPILNLIRFQKKRTSLLQWIRSHQNADAAAEAVRDDKTFGLGRAIGYKAARLFIKRIIHIYKMIDQPSDTWGPNSYEIPLDSNVGRVLMRTGIIFPFLEEDKETQLVRGGQWTEQRDGRVNLSAQRLRDIALENDKFGDLDLRSLLEKWGLRNTKSQRVLTRVLNAALMQLESERASIGTLDDGFTFIGTEYCYNTNPQCPKCDLKEICWANKVEPELKERYYCGTGEGVFFG